MSAATSDKVSGVGFLLASLTCAIQHLTLSWDVTDKWREKKHMYAFLYQSQWWMVVAGLSLIGPTEALYHLSYVLSLFNVQK